MKQRRIISEIQNYLSHKNAIVITGSRQVGKTTVLKMIYEQIPEGEKLWFDLDNPLHQKIFEELDYDDIYKEFLNRGIKAVCPCNVFIDEIQNFPEITKIIKYLIDHYQVKFFVTGSSSFYLKNLFPESLSGRKFEFNLHPLDFGEYLYFKGLLDEIPDKELYLDHKSIVDYEKFDKEYDDYLEYGAFPEVVLAQNKEEKKLIIENIFKSFFQKDILELSQYQDVKEIRELILLLTRRIGSKIDVSKVASELGVSRAKIYSYLEFLQAIFIVRLVPIYSKSVTKSVVANKKVYFLDTGFVNQIAQVSEGALFENAVANQLQTYGSLSYYQKSKKEIDFILDHKLAFEVKLTGTGAYYKDLLRASKNLDLEDQYLISKNFVEGKDLQVVFPQLLY